MNPGIPGKAPSATRQRGATLLIGMVMLVMITLVVVAAYRITASNTQAVGNMQFRDEALAAANSVLEDVIGLANLETLVNEDGVVPTRSVDVNRDGTADYVVSLAVPRCVRVQAAAGGGEDSLSGVESNVTNSGLQMVLWEIQADVNDAATGARITVVQGFRQQVGAVPASCGL